MTRDVVAHKSYSNLYNKHPIFVWGVTGELMNNLEWKIDYSFDSDIYCGVRPAIWIAVN